MNGTHIILDHQQAAAYLVADPGVKGSSIRAKYLGCLHDDGDYSDMTVLGEAWDGTWSTLNCTLLPLGVPPAATRGSAALSAELDIVRGALATVRDQLAAEHAAMSLLREELRQAQRQRDTAREGLRLLHGRFSKIRDAVLNA